MLPLGSYKYNDSKKEITFPNGSQIVFRYCSNDKDLNNFQGTECDIMYIDEATQFTEEQFKILAACVRGVATRKEDKFPKRCYLTCNPGGQGHGWVKRLFIDKSYRSGENAEEYRFIQASVFDNKALMEQQPDYLRQLEALPPKLREAWLYGRWDIYSGQFFEDFRTTPDVELCAKAGISPEEALRQRRFTHVIEPFDMSLGDCRGWNIMRSYDFGYNKPFSLGYWAVDYDGVLYRIAEIYGCTETPDEGVRWSPDEQFRRFREFEDQHPWLKGRHIVDSVADPAIWDSSRGESIADTAARYGIYFTPGDNQRIPGWMQMHYRMQFSDYGFPRMYVFNTCKAFIRTIPLMMYSETHPEDINTKLEDHCPDECRYMCMSRPVKPIVPDEPMNVLTDPLNQFAQPLGR